MTKSKKYLRTGVIAVSLLAAFSATVVMAVTPAGTQIKATGTARYSSRSGAMPAVTSNTVTTTVGQVASASVSPTSAGKPADGNSSATFALTIKNTGNGSDTFGLTATAKSGSTVTIYKDANGDGQRQSTETTKVASTGALGSGKTFKCLVVAQLPSSGSLSTDTITFTAKSQFDATKTGKSTLTVNAGQAGYIRSWLINGYFTQGDPYHGLNADFLNGEARVGPVEGDVSGNRPWFKLDSPVDRVDLANALGGPERCVAYAHVYVYSTKEQPAVLFIGSDDGVRIWLNEEQVWASYRPRGLVPDQDKVPLELAPGWNKLLVKVSQGVRGWAFTARIGDSAGNAIPGLRTAVESKTVPDTKDPVISDLNVTPGNLFAKVEWTTNEQSTTLVEYGPASASSGERFESSTLSRRHGYVLVELRPNTDYFVKVGGADATGNTVWSSRQTFRTSGEPTPAVIRSWLLNGYYRPADPRQKLSADFLGGEPFVVPAEGDILGREAWFRVDSTTDYVDLGETFAFPSECTAYAYVCIYSPEAREANLLIGSDDGVKAWLNGEVVWTNDVYRGMFPDHDRVPVRLAQGWNKLLMKVSQGVRGWAFTARIADDSGDPIPGLFYFTP